MDGSWMNLPGYRYMDYMLVLNPHEDLRNRISAVKKEFADAYDAPASIGGRPHVLLATFKVWQVMEEKILNRLKIIAMGTTPFKVALKDFGSFPSHTVYINVTTKLPIQNLIKSIRGAQRLMKSVEKDPYFTTEPYIPVARKLAPFQYEQAWASYAHKHFTASFIADGMLLLKKHTDEKGYQIVQRLEFMNLPVNTTQGQLFM
jgi:2'-5' RNA ligase